jgi:hypothetical protein
LLAYLAPSGQLTIRLDKSLACGEIRFMKNPLPGPAPMIGLMLAAILAVWLGILGPLDLPAIGRWTASAATSFEVPPILAGVVIIAAVAGMVLIVIFGTKEKPRARLSGAAPKSETPVALQTPAPLLTSVETAEFRTSFKFVLGIVGTISALHFGTAASVLPYVWISDESANCGARLVLDRAVGEMLLVVQYVFLALFGFLLVKLIDETQKLFPGMAGFLLKNKPGTTVLKHIKVPLSIALVCLIVVLIDDLRFLRHPPVVPTDATALHLCAHPSERAKWNNDSP